MTGTRDHGAWTVEYPSARVEIVETRSRQHHSLAMERDRLRFEQAALAGSLGKRPVGAHHAMPRGVVRLSAAQHIARQSRSARRDVTVGTHVTRGDRLHPPQYGCLGGSCHPLRHAPDGYTTVDAGSAQTVRERICRMRDPHVRPQMPRADGAGLLERLA
jgi:hypothetical protein